MPTSTDPVKRARQLQNLRSSSAVKHGGRSPERVQPLREKYLAELHEAFPNVPVADLRSQAQRQALISLYADYIDERGSPIRHRRQGTIYPAAQELGRLLAAHEKRNAELQVLNGRREGSPHAALAAVVAELSAAENGDPDGGKS
jgi:hypothetical protein